MTYESEANLYWRASSAIRRSDPMTFRRLVGLSLVLRAKHSCRHPRIRGRIAEIWLQHSGEITAPVCMFGRVA